MTTLTAKQTNGTSDLTVSGANLQSARLLMQAALLDRYDSTIYVEYFEDRGLVWASEEDSVDDDGARALASIYETRE